MPFTAVEQALIARRQTFLRNVVRAAFEDESYLARQSTALGSRGRWMHERMLSFARIALAANGRYLLSHWLRIRREAEIPWDLHFKRALHSSGRTLSQTTRFYRTLMGEGAWLVLPVEGIPAYSVSEGEIWEFLYPAGVHPRDAHPGVLLEDSVLAAVMGQTSTLQLRATGGMAPLAFEAAETWPSGASVSSSGLVTIVPAAPGIEELTVRVLDALDDIDEATITVAVRKAP